MKKCARWKKIVSRPEADAVKKQQEIVNYLESKVPDLEEIMLEKALKLKEDLLMERILATEQFFADKPEVLRRITEVRKMVDEGKFLRCNCGFIRNRREEKVKLRELSDFCEIYFLK